MNPDTASRRTFLTTSAATLAASSSLLPGAYAAAGNSTLRVGLVGCGGRGTGAARNALQADPHVKLVAMCDVFMDRLQESLKNLQGSKSLADKVDVAPDRCFDGFDGYQKLLNCGVDVVLLCTPPGFRPIHLRAAVEAGKHVFCEKPVAVDATGVRSVIESARLAKEKGVSLCSGFCYRYDYAKRETVKRIHDGMIGDVTAMHINYLTGPLWFRKERELCSSDMEYQMRNWYYYPWLSGDFIAEQHCHNFDKAAWVFNGQYPVSATGVGGRAVRTNPKYGHIYDHFAVALEYASGAKLFSYCRQMPGCQNDVSDYVIGTKGTAQMRDSASPPVHAVNPAGGRPWEFTGQIKVMYDVEHDELFAGIRSGKLINDGESAAYSTLMALMAREAAYSGKRVTWKQMLASKQNLAPVKYDMAANPPSFATPMPGAYQFV
jgi:myo-inositol 2-dehydrogenase / D-chiro-inositol 1-dehydrogenase